MNGPRGETVALEVERYRMAFAEAGYPDAVVGVDEIGVYTEPWTINWDEKACWLAGRTIYGTADSPCFSCWRESWSRLIGHGLLCRQGECQSGQSGSGEVE